MHPEDRRHGDGKCQKALPEPAGKMKPNGSKEFKFTISQIYWQGNETKKRSDIKVGERDRVPRILLWL